MDVTDLVDLRDLAFRWARKNRKVRRGYEDDFASFAVLDCWKRVFVNNKKRPRKLENVHIDFLRKTFGNRRNIGSRKRRDGTMSPKKLSVAGILRSNETLHYQVVNQRLTNRTPDLRRPLELFECQPLRRQPAPPVQKPKEYVFTPEQLAALNHREKSNLTRASVMEKWTWKK